MQKHSLKDLVDEHKGRPQFLPGICMLRGEMLWCSAKELEVPADSSAYLETAVHMHSFKDPAIEHKGYLDSSPEERKIQQLAVTTIDKDTLVKEFTFTLAMRSIQVRASILTLSTLLTHCFGASACIRLRCGACMLLRVHSSGSFFPYPRASFSSRT